MARARKRHVQQDIRYGDKRGGKRRKAGRPKQGVRASERHKKREALRKHEPVHVVIRANPVIGTMRRRDAYRAIRGAILHRTDSFLPTVS